MIPELCHWSLTVSESTVSQMGAESEDLSSSVINYDRSLVFGLYLNMLDSTDHILQWFWSFLLCRLVFSV